MERAARHGAAPQALGPKRCWSYAALPAEVLLLIFALVPADVRPRLALVCTAFRDVLRSPALWSRLDLSTASGVACEVTDARLRVFAARFAARAGTALTALDLSGRWAVSRDATLAVVAANPGVTVTLAHPAPRTLGHAATLALLAAAGPQLAGLVACVDCPSGADALALLRREGPFARVLAVRWLRVFRPRAEELAPLLDAVARSAGGAPQLELRGADLSGEGALGAVVDGVLKHRLPFLSLRDCRLPPDGAAALERLLRDEDDAKCPLRELRLKNSTPLFDGFHVECPLARGLKSNRSLRALSLRDSRLWDLGWNEQGHKCCMKGVLALLAAAAAHPSLRSLDLAENDMPPFPRDAGPAAADAAAGAALAALLRAPALLDLDLGHSALWPGVLTPLFSALRGRTTLQVLRCVGRPGVEPPMSPRLVNDVLAPAVARNEGLRDIFLGPGAESVERDVAQREARRQAGGDPEETRHLLRKAYFEVMSRRRQ